MKNLFTCLSKKSLSNGNGSGMDRERTGYESACSFKLFASIIFLLFLGANNAWGLDPISFTISDIDATHTEATKTPITVSIDGTVSTSSPQFRFSDAMTVSASGVYKISGISVTTNSTEAYISPLGADVSSGTWSKVTATNYTWSGNAKYVVFTPSGAVRITGISVTYYEVTDKYTVTFNQGSGTCATSSLDESTPCGGVELPSATPPSDCVAEGWVFAGWKGTGYQTSTTKKPKLYAAGSQYYPSADENLYAVYSLTEERVNCTAAKINTTAGLAVNDVVALTYDGGSPKIQYRGLNGKTYGDTIRFTTDLPKEKHLLEVREGKSDGQFAFYDLTDENYLSYSGSSNVLEVDDEVNANSSWSVSISSGVATIQNASVTSRYIKYNTNNPRFAGYTSDAGNTQFVNLYKMCPPITTYNSNPDCTYDWFFDIMHDNETIEKQGTYSAPAAPSDESKGSYCEGEHYHFLGWIEEQYLNANGTMSDATKLKAPGTSITADNKTFYAVWGKDE